MGLYSTLLFVVTALWVYFRLEFISKRLAGTKPGARVLARARSAIQNDLGSSQGPARMPVVAQFDPVRTAETPIKNRSL